MHRQRADEKVKDFKGTLLRLFKNLDRWRYMMVTSIILALLAAILSTIGPNKLADVTDVISEGIKPNTAKLEEVAEHIYQNIVINYPRQDINNTSFSVEDIDEEQLRNVLSNFKIDGVLITVDDQIQFLKCSQGFDSSLSNEELFTKMQELPLSIQSLIDSKINVDKLKYHTILLAIIYLLNSLFGYLEGFIMAYVGIGYSKRLRKEISEKINRLPLKYFDNHETGDILSRVTNDVDTIGINMSDNITSLVANITLFLGSIVMMFVTNWIMALTAIFASIFGFMFSFRNTLFKDKKNLVT